MLGFADWEPAHAVAELRRQGHCRVEVVGLSPDAVQSIAGPTVQPTSTLAAVDPEDVAVFILLGGDRWEREALEPELKVLLSTPTSVAYPLPPFALRRPRSPELA